MGSWSKFKKKMKSAAKKVEAETKTVLKKTGRSITAAIKSGVVPRAELVKLEIVGLDDDLKFSSEGDTATQNIKEQKNVNKAAMEGKPSKLAAAIEDDKTPIITTILGNRYEVKITLKNAGTSPWKKGEVWLVGSRNPKTWAQRAFDTGCPTVESYWKDLKAEKGLKDFPNDKSYWTTQPIWPPPVKWSCTAPNKCKYVTGGYFRAEQEGGDFRRGVTDLIRRANNGSDEIGIKGVGSNTNWSVLPGKTHTFKFIIRMPDGPMVFNTEWQEKPVDGAGKDLSWRPQLLMAQFALRVPAMAGVPWRYVDVDKHSISSGQKDPSTSPGQGEVTKQEKYNAVTKNPIQFVMTPVHPSYAGSDKAGKSVPNLKSGKPKAPSKGAAPECDPTRTPHWNEKDPDPKKHKWTCICKPSLKLKSMKCACPEEGYEFKPYLNNGLGGCICPKTTHIMEGKKCIKLSDIIKDLKCDPQKKDIKVFEKKQHYVWDDCEKAWKDAGKKDAPGQLMCKPSDPCKKGTKCGQCVATKAANTQPKNYNSFYSSIDGETKVTDKGLAVDTNKGLKEDFKEAFKSFEGQKYCSAKNDAGTYINEGKPCEDPFVLDIGYGRACKTGKCEMDIPKAIKLGTPNFSGIGYNDYFLTPETFITSDGFEGKDIIRVLLNAVWKQTSPNFSEFGKAFPNKYRASKIHQKWAKSPARNIGSKQSFTSYYLARMKQSKFFAALDDETIALMGIYDELSRVVEIKSIGGGVYGISFGDYAAKIGSLKVEKTISLLNNIHKLPIGMDLEVSESYIKALIEDIDSKIKKGVLFEDFNFNLKPLTLPHGHNDIKLQKMDINPNYYYYSQECDKMDKKKDETSLYFAYKGGIEPKKMPPGGLKCDSPAKTWDIGKKVLFRQQILNMLTKETDDQLLDSYPMDVKISIPTSGFYPDKKISEQQINKEAEGPVKEILGKAGLAAVEEKELLLKKFMSYYGPEKINDNAPTKPYYRSTLRTTPEKISLRYINSNNKGNKGYEGEEPISEKRVVTFSQAALWDSDVMMAVPDDAINSVDAAFNVKDQSRTIIHFFQGENWYISSGTTGTSARTIESGFPKKISKHWPPPSNVNKDGPGFGSDPKGTIPNDPDAVLHIPPEMVKTDDFSNPILFFKGLKMWIYEYDMQKIVWSGDIKDMIPGLPSGVDSAFMWPRNKGIYLFKGKQYWKLDNDTLQVLPEYPRLIAGDKEKGYDGWGVDLRDIGAAFVDAAGDTIMFKGSRYYILDAAGVGHTKKWPNSDKGWDIATYWKTPDSQGISKIKNRTWEDIKNGKFANFEVIGYRIIKHRDAPTEDLPIGKDEIQSYFVPYDADSQTIKILDTQVKYDTPYYYSVMAVLIVHGNAYSYKFVKNRDSVDINDTLPGVIPDIWFSVDQWAATRMLEVPLVHSKEQRPTRILAEPPMPPLLHIHSYKGVNDELLLDFEKGLGYIPKKVMLTYEKEQVDEWKRIRDSVKQSFTPLDIADDEMIFSGKSTIEKFLFYRLENKPEKIQDFLNVEPIEIPIENTLYRDKIIPNKKYYYASRSKDVYGIVSYLGDPFQVEIVDDGGTVFAIIEPFYIKEKKEKIEKHFKKKIRIRPAFLQAAPNKDRIKPTLDERVVGHLEETVFTELSEGNLFKIRITSKKTNRKIDLNVRFIQEKLKVGEKGYPENDAKSILTWEQD